MSKNEEIKNDLKRRKRQKLNNGSPQQSAIYSKIMLLSIRVNVYLNDVFQLLFTIVYKLYTMVKYIIKVQNLIKTHFFLATKCSQADHDVFPRWSLIPDELSSPSPP